MPHKPSFEASVRAREEARSGSRFEFQLVREEYRV